MKLYRGFNTRIEDGILPNPFIKTPRVPKNTSSYVHTIADQWFQDRFGIKARSSTIFCSNDLSQALSFRGNNNTSSIAEIIPIGDYTIIYSADVFDFTEYQGFINELDGNSIISWLNSKKYTSINNSGLITPCFRGELMLYCEEFKLINL